MKKSLKSTKIAIKLKEASNKIENKDDNIKNRKNIEIIKRKKIHQKKHTKNIVIKKKKKDRDNSKSVTIMCLEFFIIRACLFSKNHFPSRSNIKGVTKKRTKSFLT